MIFSIQAHIENYFNVRQINDTDGYALRFAKYYFNNRIRLQMDDLFAGLAGIKTILFRNNLTVEKPKLIRALVGSLDEAFPAETRLEISFPGGLRSERKKLSARAKRITIRNLLQLFKEAVEARGIDIFWESRKRGKLRPKPEKIAQGLFAVFCRDTPSGVDVLREFVSGIGFVDAALLISRTIHLVEIKILTNSFLGVEQLEEYMKKEGKQTGYLLVFDARPHEKRSETPSFLDVSCGRIHVVRIDINPIAPSRLNVDDRKSRKT